MSVPAKNNRWAPVFMIVILLAALFFVKKCRSGKAIPDNPSTEQTDNTRGLNRHPAAMHYSKHARCRMACRHIDETEVKEVLADGKINYAKSEVGNRPDCRKKYAVEGRTNDGQHVRIIFAPCQSEMTVVTVIDLDTEWSCDCE